MRLSLPMMRQAPPRRQMVRSASHNAVPHVVLTADRGPATSEDPATFARGLVNTRPLFFTNANQTTYQAHCNSPTFFSVTYFLKFSQNLISSFLRQDIFSSVAIYIFL